MEGFLIAIIFALAAAYVFRFFYKAFKSKEPACGCGSCSGGCSNNYGADGNEKIIRGSGKCSDRY